MKFVKFILSDKGSVTVDEEQARKILISKEQVHIIRCLDGKWKNNESINKAHIVRTVYDPDATREWNVAEREKQLNIEKQNEENRLLNMSQAEKDESEAKRIATSKKVSQIAKQIKYGNAPKPVTKELSTESQNKALLDTTLG